MKNVFIKHGDTLYNKMFIQLGWNIVDNVDDASLVCFTGGADVSPAYYNHLKHQYTYNDPFRDAIEEKLFLECQVKNIPMVGICRGGQFLNVLSGGAMYQHVDKHTTAHEIIDAETGETILVTSTHHQMMMPSNDGKVVAFSTLGGNREFFDTSANVFKIEQSMIDNEVVYYAHTRCLCFQPHPEMNGFPRMREYFGELINKYLGV